MGSEVAIWVSKGSNHFTCIHNGLDGFRRWPKRARASSKPETQETYASSDSISRRLLGVDAGVLTATVWDATFPRSPNKPSPGGVVPPPQVLRNDPSYAVPAREMTGVMSSRLAK